MTRRAVLAHTRTGSGEPLVLLHGLGSSRHAWAPVISLLAERFEVIAIDLPGFGDSEQLPCEVEPHPAAIAAVVAGTLSGLGVSHPHVVGNSLGGWVCLEIAAMHPVRSVTLLSPAGLWGRQTPIYCRVNLRVSRFLARYAGWLVRPLVGTRVGRALLLGQSVGRPGRMTPAQARAAVAAIGRAPGFRATLRATLRRRYLSNGPITAPVTLAFGTRDRILLAGQSRYVDQLPAHTRRATIEGAGHVPMSDDPLGVAGLIARTAAQARPVEEGGAT